MVFRRIQIPVWLVAATFLATFVIGGMAGPAVLPAVESSFHIVTPGVSEVIVEDVTPEIAQNLRMGQPQGVVVTDLIYSPLRPGDVILSINGNPVGCRNVLIELLAHIAPGQSFSVEIFREGHVQTVTVQRGGLPPVAQETVDIRGISVASLPAQNGVVVTDVQIGTPASDAGLKRGDIILDVDKHPVRTAGEFGEFMTDLNDRDAIFNVRQTDGWLNVFVIPA